MFLGDNEPRGVLTIQMVPQLKQNAGLQMAEQLTEEYIADWEIYFQQGGSQVLVASWTRLQHKDRYMWKQFPGHFC